MNDVLLEAQRERAIDDIGERHVYADMLCERGDPRGEFIRLQLLANLSAEQEQRATQLFRQHRLAWLGSLAAFVEFDDRPASPFGAYWHEGGEIRIRFCHGFLHTCPLRDGLSVEQTREALAHPLMATVRVLRLFGEDCFDLSRLSRLTRLHLVDECPDLSEVYKLTQLKQLRLFQATELEPLTRMPALTHLDLDLNLDVQVQLAPLALLHQLEVLDIPGLPDLRLISGLTSLRSLSTEVSGDCDLSPLVALSKLESLELYRTEVTGLSPLAGLTNLVTLVLDEPDDQDAAPESRGHDVSHLRKLSKLEVVSLGEVSDLSALSNMPMLRELTIYGKECHDLSPIAGCTMLEKLSVYNSSVSGLEPLGNLKRLKFLTIGKSPIQDISPLADLLALEELDIESTNVADLRSLSALTRLRKLNINRTQVSDLSPLSRLCNLDELWCDQSNVSGQGIQKLQQALPYLDEDQWPSTFVVGALEEGAQRIFETPEHREGGEDVLFTIKSFQSGISRLYVYLDIVDQDPTVGHEIARDQLEGLRPEEREDDVVKLEIYYLAEDRDRAQKRAKVYEKLLGFESVYERAQPLRGIEHLPAKDSAETLAWRDRRARNPDPVLTGDCTAAFLPETLLGRLGDYLEQKFVLPTGPPEDRSWWGPGSTLYIDEGDKEHPTTISFHYIADSDEQDAILDWLQVFFASLGFPYQVRFYRKLNLSSTYYPEDNCTTMIAGPKEVLREYNGSQFPMLD